MDLTGKIAAVFGASSEGGTGWTIAEVLAARGAQVVVSARSMPGLERLAAKIGGVPVRCDVSVEAEVAHLSQSMQLQGHSTLLRSTPLLLLEAEVAGQGTLRMAQSSRVALMHHLLHQERLQDTAPQPLLQQTEAGVEGVLRMEETE